MNSTKKILGFDDKWLVITGIPVVAFLMAAMMYGDFLVKDPGLFFKICAPVSFIYTVVYWLVFRYLLILYRRQFPQTKDTVRRLVYQLLTVVAGYFLLKIILDPILHDYFGGALGDKLRHEIGMSIGSLMVTFLVLGIYETVGFYNQLQHSLVEKERLKKENVQSQLESLRNQVNPHFFFNSLNTLAYLIPEDAEKAVNYVQKLSKAYRYILEIRDKMLAPLSDELDFLKSYTCLLQERFGQNLEIKIDVPPEFYTYNIVPLCLQMLFENAIKHNIVSTQHPLTIEVFVEKDARLIVKNNLQRKKQEIPSTKVGLGNICSRYKLVSELEVEVIPTQQSFIVVLPLLKPEVREPHLT
jgi:two-component system, LytTR family, sensor kinase